jgi:anaerobic magnesium-protoporphyrin IX monomethyl ester cyclase
MINKSILMVYPKTGFDVEGAIAPPFALLTIAAPLLKEGYQVKIIDQRTNPLWEKELKDELTKKPLYVALTSMSGTQIKFAIRASQIIREYSKEIPIIWGGTHVTILPEQTLENPNIDIVVVGEGENTILEITDALANHKSVESVKGIYFKKGNGEQVSTGERPMMNIEELLPTPWELVDVEKYIYKDFYMRKVRRTLDIGQTSRGCPYSCGFCCSAHIRKYWRAMSPEKSINRIASDVKRFKLDSIWIRDDNFFANLDRAKEICEGFIKNNLNIKWYTSGTRADAINRMSHEQITVFKKAGAEVFKIGAESGSNRVLKLINKKCTVEELYTANMKAKKYDIIPAMSFIGGFPTETYDELMETIDCMIKVKKDNPDVIVESMCIYTPYPKTSLWPLAMEHGLNPPQKLEEWADWGFHDFNDRRNPWLSAAARRRLGNISYISTLSSVVDDLTNAIKNPFKRFLVKILVKPISFYYRWRFKNKLFNWLPELTLIRWIRHKMFDEVK